MASPTTPTPPTNNPPDNQTTMEEAFPSLASTATTQNQRGRNKGKKSSSTATSNQAASPKRTQTTLTGAPAPATQNKRVRQATTSSRRSQYNHSTAMEVDDDDATVAATNEHNTTLPHVTQADIKISVLKNEEDPDKELRSTIMALLKKMQQYSQTHIIAWYEDSSNITIRRADEIPQRTSELRKYFPSIRPVPGGGFVYSKVRFATEFPLATLMNDVSWFTKQKKHGIYPWSVQGIDKLADAGWILYSLKTIPKPLLASAIQAHLPPSVPIGLQFKGAEQENRVPYKERVFSYHVQCDEQDVGQVQMVLKTILCHDSDVRLLGSKFRFVPHITYAKNPDAVSKIARLRARQLAFTEAICSKTISSIVDLDVSISDENGKKLPTLRQMIMEIHSRQFPERQLFHSIGKSWQNANNYLLQSVPSVANEAAMMADNLVTVLKHKYGKEVTQYFHLWAVTVCADDKYDPETGHVTTITDSIVTELLDGDDDLDFTKSAAPTTTTRPEPAFASTTTNLFPSDDTISTLGTLGPKETNGRANLSFAPPQIIHGETSLVQRPSDLDDQSVVSAVTINTMQSNITELRSMMHSIMQRLPEVPAQNQTNGDIPSSIDLTEKATSSSSGGGQG